MAIPTTATPSAALGASGSGPGKPVSVAASAHGYTPGCTCVTCEAKRRKWREKAAARAARPGAAPVPALGPAQPAPGAGGQVAGATPAPGAAPAPGGDPNFVPWTADTLRPLFERVVPVIEKKDKATFKELAAEISPAAVALVEKKGGWDEAAKATVIESGSQVSAKWANR